MDKDLSRNDWLKAARMALLTGGVEAVRVEKLARNLRVTKGSFYWHFKDREELLDLLLREWEEELLKDIIPRLNGRRGREALRLLLRLMVAAGATGRRRNLAIGCSDVHLGFGVAGWWRGASIGLRGRESNC